MISQLKRDLEIGIQEEKIKPCTKRIFDDSHFGVVMELAVVMSYGRTRKVETLIHDSIRELVTWECKEHGVKS